MARSVQRLLLLLLLSARSHTPVAALARSCSPAAALLSPFFTVPFLASSTAFALPPAAAVLLLLLLPPAAARGCWGWRGFPSIFKGAQQLRRGAVELEFHARSTRVAEGAEAAAGVARMWLWTAGSPFAERNSEDNTAAPNRTAGCPHRKAGCSLGGFTGRACPP
jgi:hypothetical protein